MSDEMLDRPGAVREGERLDGARLLAYLEASLPGVVGPLEAEQFPAGYSNLTYLLRAGGGREFVLRRPPFGSRVKSAHDMGREFLILSKLRPLYPKVPRPVLFCEDEAVLGAPFYLMERVRGVILRARTDAAAAPAPEVMRRLSESFAENLSEIHAVDYRAAGLGELERPGSYVRRQIGGWTKRYEAARTEAVPEIERLARWLDENAPPDSGRALVHNDYKYDNLVLSPGDLSRVAAVLDWEMATVGDPLMDLGTTLGYWVDADDAEEWRGLAFGLTARPGNFTRRELVERYTRLSGRDPGDSVFYFAAGLLKIAVIAQQIYYRYRHGLTTDSRFAGLGPMVRACGGLALRAVEKKRVDGLG